MTEQQAPVQVAQMVYRGEMLKLLVGSYAARPTQTAVILEDGDGAPYATLSVNLVDQPDLPEGTFWLKDYSENENVARLLVDSRLIEPAEVEPAQGHMTVQAWRFVDCSCGDSVIDTRIHGPGPNRHMAGIDEEGDDGEE